MKAKLMLGCHGRMEYGYVMCAGTLNVILDFSNLPDDKEVIYEYLDSHCKLFDKVTNDTNKVGNIVQYLSRQKILPAHIEQSIYEYISMHKKCGFYMYIEPID